GGALTMHCDGSFRYVPSADHIGDAAFTYTVSDGVTQTDVQAVVHTVGISIRSVTLENGFTVSSAPRPGVASAPYSADHWLDANGDGDADDSGDHQWPYAYRRSTDASASKLEVRVEFVLTAAWNGGDIWIQASGPDQIRMDPDKATVDPMRRDRASIRLTAATAFPKKVKAYPEFQLSWQASSQSANAGWANIGTTKNPVYLTFSSPVAGLTLYHTLVHLGSTAAEGADTEDLVKTKVWDEFKDLNVTNYGGDRLHYYKKYTNGNLDTEALLTHKDGQCGSWASLFLDVLKAQGISWMNNFVKVEVDGTQLLTADERMRVLDYGFLVKHWNFAGAGKARDAVDASGDPVMMGLLAKFPYINVPKPDFIGDTTYKWHYADVTDREGIPGQGERNPASWFNNHQFVQMQTATGVRWYDPSYGVTYDGAMENDRLGAFDRMAVAGYYVAALLDVKEGEIGVDLNGDMDTTDTVLWVGFLIKENDPAALELKATVSTIP
ncbi:MAG: cadherin-like domain-containing protein, partial [Candidatus Caldarchaeum sp.]